MFGKAKCKILKEIRQRIADENDIPYVVEECTHQGNCAGTCPRCEQDLRYLERELEKRQALGKAVTVTALAATLTAGLSACKPTATAGDPLPPPGATDATYQDLGGAVPVPTEELMGDMAPPYTEELMGDMAPPYTEELPGESVLEELNPSCIETEPETTAP